MLASYSVLIPWLKAAWLALRPPDQRVLAKMTAFSLPGFEFHREFYASLCFLPVTHSWDSSVGGMDEVRFLLRLAALTNFFPISEMLPS